VSDGLRLAIPKGSLEQTTLELLAAAGITVERVGRSLRLASSEPTVEPLLLRPQEMARYVADGAVDAGVTGFDWVAEQQCADRVEVVAELSYSKAQTARPIRWVLAVDADAGIVDVDDLRARSQQRPLRVATEMPNVAGAWLREHGIEAEVVVSWGATEAKVPDLADAVMECTETGGSLRANDLHPVATVLESHVQVIADPDLASRAPERHATLRWLADLLAGALAARHRSIVAGRLPAGSGGIDLPGAHEVRRHPDADGGCLVEAVVGTDEVAATLRRLRDHGGRAITVSPLSVYLD
jgi:ATP phosphoribosyltransferase